MLFILSQKFEKDNGLYLGKANENDKTNEIAYKKQNQRMAVELMSCFSLHHKNLKETKDSIWRMTMRMMKSMKVYTKLGKVSVAAIVV